MGLASSMNTALTGMSGAETQIDVVGNNLANSETVGFKASSVDFATQFSQTLSLGSSVTATNGGTNPKQTGLGVTVAAITADFSQGTISESSSSTDMAIEGNGFFVVQGTTAGSQYYTRNGEFTLNSANQLVTSSGNRVLGYTVDGNYNLVSTELTAITIPLGSATVAEATSNVYLEGDLTPSGDLSTQGTVLTSATLCNNTYGYPSDNLDTGTNLIAPTTTISGNATANANGSVTTGTYTYVYVISNTAANGSSNAPDPYSEQLVASSNYGATVTIDSGNSPATVTLSNLDPITTNDRYVNIYRAEVDANGTVGTYYYIGQTDGSANTFTDDVSQANASGNAAVDTSTLTGSYQYTITYIDDNGYESQPTTVLVNTTVGASKIVLSNLPEAANGHWTGINVYRTTDGGSTYYKLTGTRPDGSFPMDSNGVYYDNTSDPELLAANHPLNLNGTLPISYSTDLVNLTVRSSLSTSPTQVYTAGTLNFTGTKGGRTLDTKTLAITDTTTVNTLINFMDQAWGIRTTTNSSGVTAGGTIIGNTIVFTGNDGTGSSLGVTSLTETANGATSTVNMSFVTSQAAVGESAETDFIAYDSLGTSVHVSLTMSLLSSNSSGTVYQWYADSYDNQTGTSDVSIGVGSGTITFDSSGNVISSTGNPVTVSRNNSAAESPLRFSLDFSAISGLATNESTLSVSSQDGSSTGTLTSYIIGENGLITGVFSNGVSRTLGQLVLARFTNPNGLESIGDNLYTIGVNSGLPVIGKPQTLGLGNLVAGATELSNTDIGTNLVQLITASTMYRGSARVITTCQQLLDELLNLKR